MTKQRQAILMGDGGVNHSMPAIDLYAIATTGLLRPKIMMLPAASLDNQGYIEYFEKVFSRYPCETMVLATSDLPTRDLEDYVMQADILYAGAGNTKNGLALWRGWGLDAIFKKAVDNGVMWVGGSAGMASAFSEAITDSMPGTLSVEQCLGLLPNFSGCAHYTSRQRRKTYKTAVCEGRIKPGFGIDEGAAIHFIDEEVYRSVSSNEKAKAFQVGVSADGKLEHRKLPTAFLGDKDIQNELIWNSLPFQEVMEKRRRDRASREIILRKAS